MDEGEQHLFDSKFNTASTQSTDKKVHLTKLQPIDDLAKRKRKLMSQMKKGKNLLSKFKYLPPISPKGITPVVKISPNSNTSNCDSSRSKMKDKHYYSKTEENNPTKPSLFTIVKKVPCLIFGYNKFGVSSSQAAKTIDSSSFNNSNTQKSPRDININPVSKSYFSFTKRVNSLSKTSPTMKTQSNGSFNYNNTEGNSNANANGPITQRTNFSILRRSIKCEGNINSSFHNTTDPFFTVYSQIRFPFLKSLGEANYEKMEKLKKCIEIRNLCLEEEIIPLIEPKTVEKEAKKKNLLRLAFLVKGTAGTGKRRALDFVNKVTIQQNRDNEKENLIKGNKDDLKEYNRKIMKDMTGKVSHENLKKLNSCLKDNYYLSNNKSAQLDKWARVERRMEQSFLEYVTTKRREKFENK